MLISQLPKSIRKMLNNKYTRFIYYRYRIYKDKNLPQSINIELTNACNSKCNICPRENLVRTNQMRVGHIDFKLFKKIIDSIPNHENILTLVGLGEPLLYPKLKEAIRYIKKKKPKSFIRLSSNGIALNEKNAKILINNLDSSDDLTISLNAASRKVHKMLMGVDQYDNVISNIKRFIELRKKLKSGRAPRLIIQLLESKTIKKETEKFQNYWQPLLEPNDVVSVKSMLNWSGQIDEEKMGVKNKGKRYPCYSLWTSISIDVQGNIYPCCEAFSTREKSQLKLGNLKQGDMAALYQKRVEPFRRIHQMGKWNQIEECKKCDFWSDIQNVWFKGGERWY